MTNSNDAGFSQLRRNKKITEKKRSITGRDQAGIKRGF